MRSPDVISSHVLYMFVSAADETKTQKKREEKQYSLKKNTTIKWRAKK